MSSVRNKEFTDAYEALQYFYRHGARGMTSCEISLLVTNVSEVNIKRQLRDYQKKDLIVKICVRIPELKKPTIIYFPKKHEVRA